MRYALDASVAIKWVLPEADSARALRLRADVDAGIHQLLAPDIFPVEVAHALTRAERRRIIPVGHADLHLANILSSSPRLEAYLSLLRRALSISSAMRVGVYDCIYVALAEREGCELVTADDQLVKKLQPLFPFIRSLATLP